MTDIKVGSEWVSNTDSRFTILAIDEDKLFVKYTKGDHMIISEEGLRKFCKPLPKRRTVWLNVYEEFATCNNTKEQADMVKGDNVLFQQEVEIVDPRGAKK